MPLSWKIICGKYFYPCAISFGLLFLWAPAGRAASYFLALDIPPETQQSIVNRQNYIAQFLPANTTVVWHPTNNIHITLQGIADTLNADQLAVLSAAMKKVARSAERFNLADKIVNSTYEVWDGYIVFKLKPSRTLRKLGDAIYAAVKDVLPHDSVQKYFHISMGTYTGSADKNILKSLSVWAPACSAFPVDNFVLRKSNYPEHPRRYDAVERYYYRNKALLSSRDYDGDGRTDLSVYNSASGQWLLIMIANLANVYSLQTAGSVRPVSGMFDSENKCDIGTYRESDGNWTILCSTSNYAGQTFFLGGAGFIPVPGDYDADGITDPAAYQEEEGYWKFLLSDSDYDADEGYLGGIGFTPAPEDYDGDGETDMAVYQEATGWWQVMLSDSAYETASVYFGGAGWMSVPADYDGDGLADPAVYQSATGEWLVVLSGSSYEPIFFSLGGPGWRTTPGDYDGDGLADPAVYQESSGLWQTLLSGSDYLPVSISLGGSGWVNTP